MYPARLSPPVEQTKKQTLAQKKKKVAFSPDVQIKDNDTITKAIMKFHCQPSTTPLLPQQAGLRARRSRLPR